MSECLFCKIAEHKIQSKLLYEDEHIVAFRDINPQAPVHILIIPKKHISSVNELKNTDDDVIGRINRVASELARKESISQCGYRLVVNTGPDAGQAVEHLHYHLLGGRKMIWPPG